MNVLAIETSCDETAVAVISEGKSPWHPEVRSSVVASQEDIHALFGGVIPELASRRHVEVLPRIFSEALKKAGISLKDIDGIAVTHCPGLMGALLVGLSFAKGLAFALNRPLIGVNHLAGHLGAALLQGDGLLWPHLGLVASGGHSSLYLGESPGCYRLLGVTKDDAAGEAFDKVAKLMNLGYPGGPAMERLARNYRYDGKMSGPFKMPNIRLKKGQYHFSFSGLKTAFTQFIRCHSDYNPAQLAFFFHECVGKIFQEPILRAFHEFRPKALVFSGGVAANQYLREKLNRLCKDHGITFQVPAIKWCTDNAAMIGVVGLLKLKLNQIDDLNLKAIPYDQSNPLKILENFFPKESLNGVV